MNISEMRNLTELQVLSRHRVKVWTESVI